MTVCGAAQVPFDERPISFSTTPCVEKLIGSPCVKSPGGIPSERTLCAELGVSRPTWRAAVGELVANDVTVLG